MPYRYKSEPARKMTSKHDGQPSGKPRLGTGTRVMRALIFRLARLGIVVQPYFVVREGSEANLPDIALDPRFSSGFIGVEDIPELVRVEPGIHPDQCVDRFERGLLCFAVKEENRVVAKMWCDLEEFNFPPNRRRLGSREAYLFNAYTDPSVRGKSLAPFMRLQCYAALRALGRDSFLSYTDYWNLASRRFKMKLGATNECLRVHIAVFGRFSRTFTLRRYVPPR